jgi:hypothetical protein
MHRSASAKNNQSINQDLMLLRTGLFGAVALSTFAVRSRLRASLALRKTYGLRRHLGRSLTGLERRRERKRRKEEKGLCQLLVTVA